MLQFQPFFVNEGVCAQWNGLRSLFSSDQRWQSTFLSPSLHKVTFLDFAISLLGQT